MWRVVPALALLLAACAHGGEPTAFAPNQVWRMKDPPSPGARVVVDAVETVGGRTVVRYSIVEVDSAALTQDWLRGLGRIEGEATLEAFLSTPVHQVTSSMFFDNGRWESGAGMAWMMATSTPVEGERSTSEITDLATFDAVLRPDLARRPERPGALQEIFAAPEHRMSLMMPIYPEEREIVLAKPLSETLEEIAAARRAARAARAEPLRPPPPRPPSPPESPGPDEIPADNAALDEACRARLALRQDFALRYEKASRDLNARRAVFGLPPMPDVDRPEPVYSNVHITRSPEWGVIWRADLALGGTRSPSRRCAAGDAIRTHRRAWTFRRMRCARPTAGLLTPP